MPNQFRFGLIKTDHKVLCEFVGLLTTKSTKTTKIKLTLAGFLRVLRVLRGEKTPRLLLVVKEAKASQSISDGGIHGKDRYD